MLVAYVTAEELMYSIPKKVAKPTVLFGRCRPLEGGSKMRREKGMYMRHKESFALCRKG
jgi:hypothetical protein